MNFESRFICQISPHVFVAFFEIQLTLRLGAFRVFSRLYQRLLLRFAKQIELCD